MTTGNGGIDWGDVATWSAFALSLVVAINQFFGSRPGVEIMRRGGFAADKAGESFILRVFNPTPVNIHLYGCVTFGGNSRALMPTHEEEHVDERYRFGTINLLVPPKGEAQLSVVVAKGRWMLYAIHWRRLTGLHLFHFIPLFAVASPQRLAALAQAKPATQPRPPEPASPAFSSPRRNSR